MGASNKHCEAWWEYPWQVYRKGGTWFKLNTDVFSGKINCVGSEFTFLYLPQPPAIIPQHTPALELLHFPFCTLIRLLLSHPFVSSWNRDGLVGLGFSFESLTVPSKVLDAQCIVNKYLIDWPINFICQGYNQLSDTSYHYKLESKGSELLLETFSCLKENLGL